jgi:hypothetical protein
MGNFWFGEPKGMSNKDNMTTCHTFGKTVLTGKTWKAVLLCFSLYSLLSLINSRE